jgi:hypothetical protein
MKNISAILFVLMTSACATLNPSAEAYSFDQANELAVREWVTHKNNIGYTKFSNAFFISVSRYSNEAQKCQLLGKDKEGIVLVQNEAGVIQHAISENENKKTQCVKEVFLGRTFPKPPFSPTFKALKL